MSTIQGTGGSRRLGTARALVLTAGWLLAHLGCGSSSSQANARDDVTTASCDWEQMCGNIGSGKTFSSRDNCMVQLRATWDSAWPAQSCDGKINSAQLRLCLDAIPLAKCDDSLGLVLSLAANCSQTKVCAGP